MEDKTTVWINKNSLMLNLVVHKAPARLSRVNIPFWSEDRFQGYGTDGRKGIDGRRLEWQRQLEEEDTIIVKWAQEDVETLYSLINKYNKLHSLT